MATTILSTLDNALKRVYAPAMAEALNNTNVIYNRVTKSTEGIMQEGSGLNTYIPVYHKRGAGRGWRAEGGTLPTARNPGYSQMKTSLAYVYATLNVSRQALHAAKSDSVAFARGLESQIKALNDGLMFDINSAFWGDGSGAIGRINQASGSVTAGDAITVDDASMLEPGMVIDSYAAKTGGSASLDSKTIDQVDYTNNTFTLTTTETLSDNFWLFMEDSRGLACMGLLGIIDDGDYATTIQNITRSTNLWTNANDLNNSGTNRSISASLIQQGYERGEIMRGVSPTVIMSGYGVRRAYFDLLQADKRFCENMELDGGFTALSYTGGKGKTPWVVDRQTPKNMAFFINEADLNLYHTTNGVTWVDEDGAVLSRGADDSFDARAAYYLTLASKGQFPSHSVIRDITE